MNPNPNRPMSDGIDERPEPLSYADMFSNARRFSDVMEEINPQGDFIPMGELLDRELCVISIRFSQTKKGPAAFPVCVNDSGEIFHTFTASKVLVPKLQNVTNHLPVLLRFVEKEGGNFGRFYDIE